MNEDTEEERKSKRIRLTEEPNIVGKKVSFRFDMPDGRNELLNNEIINLYMSIEKGNSCTNNMIQNIAELEIRIEEQLEEKARKANLSVLNVKKIIKEVVSNEDVVQMITCSAEGKECNFIQPKLTRSKTKELLEPFSIEIEPNKPKKSEYAYLLEEELSDDSSDDEYTPHESDTESKVSELLPDSPFPCSPFDHSTVLEEPVVDEVRLENIGQRTRSKLSLSETPLEAIEQQFIPPDITTDMYDTECDNQDWLNFLKDIQQPIEDKINETIEDDNDPEYNVMSDEALEKLDFEELRHDRAVKVTKKELHNLMNEWFGCEGPFSSEDEENCTNVSGPEKEVLQLSEVPVTSVQENSITIGLGTDPQNFDSEDQLNIPDSTKNSDIPELSYEQSCLLKQHIQQHIQLLLQSFLFTYKHPFLDNTSSNKSKEMVLALHFLGKFENSYFNALNLSSSLQLIKDWETFLSNPAQFNNYKNFIFSEVKKGDQIPACRKYLPGIPVHIMNLCANSTAFLYPLLLPNCGVRMFRHTFHEYSHFETTLIAIGLEEFYDELGSESKVCNRTTVCDLISRYLIPSRTGKSIKDHIRTMKQSKLSNPIKSYLETKKSVCLNHYVVPLPRQSLRLLDQPPQLLPSKWQEFYRRKKRSASHINRTKTLPKKNSS